GAGGKFTADDDMTPQIYLQPRDISPPPHPSQPANPEYFDKPKMLPRKARHGDLWVAHHEARIYGELGLTTSLGLGVTGGGNARWAQVLLGPPQEGSREPRP